MSTIGKWEPCQFKSLAFSSSSPCLDAWTGKKSVHTMSADFPILFQGRTHTYFGCTSALLKNGLVDG